MDENRSGDLPYGWTLSSEVLFREKARSHGEMPSIECCGRMGNRKAVKAAPALRGGWGNQASSVSAAQAVPVRAQIERTLRDDGGRP
jgi:hypothetical protein